MPLFPLSRIGQILTGIVVTVVLAYVCGAAGGYIIRSFGSKDMVYEDKDEFA